MVTGVLFTIAACFCWSLVFIIPTFLSDFHSIEIALGRFFVYGLISFLLLIFKKRELFSKQYAFYWKKASYLSLLSTIIGYTATVLNIQYAGPAIATLAFATVPIIIALAGNFHKKEFPSKKLFLPLSLMIFGIFLAKFKGVDDPTVPLSSFAIGLFFGLIGIGSWTWFAVDNAQLLKQNNELPSGNWGLMLGTSTFFYSLILSAFLFIFLEEREKYFVFTPQIQNFILSSLILGSLCTWLPFFLWNQGSKRLPISLTGQLMVFEIIFALLIIYLLENKLPTFAELTGIFFMLAGVFLGFKKLRYLSTSTSH